MNRNYFMILGVLATMMTWLPQVWAESAKAPFALVELFTSES